MAFLRVGMYVLLGWTRDLYHSHQQYHTTIKTEYPEKLDWDVIDLLGSQGFQDTQDVLKCRYMNTHVYSGVLILTHPH